MAEQPGVTDRKLTVDGQDASSVKYAVRFNADAPKTIESVDLKFANGRKEVAAFENLNRHEAESILGKKNIASIEAGTGALKKGQEKDSAGNIVAAQGKLEKEALEVVTASSADINTSKIKSQPGKEKNIPELDRISQEAPGFTTSAKPVTKTAELPDNSIEQVKLIDQEVRDNAARLQRARANQAELATSQPPVTRDGGNQLVNDDAFAGHNVKKTQALPDGLEQKYLQVGNKYHYAGKPDLQAFEDKGNKLQTNSNSEQVAGDLVRIAAARGWDDIRVKGSEEFRRQVWLEASVQGIKVQGHKPTEADLAMLERRNREAPANAVEKGDAKVKEVQDAKHPERAEKENAASNKAQEKADAFRNGDRDQVIKKHPDLAPAYGVLKASELFAQEKIERAADRTRFTQTTKETLARFIQEDRKMPQVVVKEQQQAKEQKKEAVLDR